MEVLQGCGNSSGGAEVLLQLAHPAARQPIGQVRFTVKDAGGFQNFKARTVGTIETEKVSPLILRVIPQTKPGAAVMDLRQIVLRPVSDSRAAK